MSRVRHDVSGCWIWTGAQFSAAHRPPRAMFLRGGKKRYASRVSYELFNGEIPDGLVVRHTCDVPLCVNPNHLILGTQLDNIADRVARGRNGNALGERHPKAVLTAEKVRSIREKRATGRSWAKLASEFGTSIYCVRYAVERGWRHV